MNMRRVAADVGCLLLVIVGHAIALPLAAWRAWRGGVSPGSPAYRAALHWDLMIAALLGAPDGWTVSTWAARRRPARAACAFCALLERRWPTHCDDSADVAFVVRRAPPE